MEILVSESYVDVTGPESIEIVLLLHSHFLPPGKRKEAFKTLEVRKRHNSGKAEIEQVSPGFLLQGHCNTGSCRGKGSNSRTALPASPAESSQAAAFSVLTHYGMLLW